MMQNAVDPPAYTNGLLRELRRQVMALPIVQQEQRQQQQLLLAGANANANANAAAAAAAASAPTSQQQQNQQQQEEAGDGPQQGARAARVRSPPRADTD